AGAGGVERLGIHNVVDSTGLPEAAVGPGDIDRAGAVDLGRRQRPLAQAAGDRVVPDGGDCGNRAPAHAGIGRVICADRGLVGVGGRHGHGAIGPHDRLAADDAGVVRRRHAPGEAAVGRAAHLHAVARAVVVPFGVAVAVEWAGRGVVADDPVLVGAD